MNELNGSAPGRKQAQSWLSRRASIRKGTEFMKPMSNGVLNLEPPTARLIAALAGLAMPFSAGFAGRRERNGYRKQIQMKLLQKMLWAALTVCYFLVLEP